MYIHRNLKDILLVFFSTAVFLLWKGFIFNSADQAEPLVLVYEKLNPGLFPGDFYVEAAKDIFTVRYYYINLLAFLGGYFSLYHISLFFTVLCLFVSGLGLIKIARKLTFGQITGYLAPFFVLFMFLSWTIGGNVVQYHLLIASSFAKALSIWGIYFLLDKKWKTSAALIGLGGLFQVLVGLQLGLIIAGILLLTQRWKILIQWLFIWLLAIAPMLLPILYRQFFMEQPEQVDMNAYYDLLYKFRNPQHYLPSLFPLTAYIKLGILISAGFFAGLWFLQKKTFYQVMMFNAIIITGLIFYSFLIEVLGVSGIGKLQWFKTTIWLEVSSALCFAIAAEYFLYQIYLKRYIWIIGLLLPFMWLLRGHFTYGAPLALDHRTEEQKDLEVMHGWIAKNTSKEAMFSTYLSDESFSCEAHRPVASMIGPMVHEPWYLISWYENFYRQYGVKDTVHDLSETKAQAEAYYESGQWQDDVRSDYSVMKKGIELSQYSKVHETQYFQLLKRNKD